MTARAQVAAARRLVVKVGSTSLTSLDGGLDAGRLEALVAAVAGRRRTGSQVVLVSSGAIAAGLAPLGLTRKPRDLATLQAAASVGQVQLAHAYAAAFAGHGITVGQVLLTADDMIRRSHYRNAQRTMERLLGLGVLPVVNENDTVATEEIRAIGDNDHLAALVAHLIGADALVLLSDVDGLYDAAPHRPGARLLAEVDTTADLKGVHTAAPSELGTGGMAGKLDAATLAASAGIPVLLAAARDAAAALDTAADGAKVGTAFRAHGRRMSARRFWVLYAADVRGRLDLDDGAVAAVIGRRRSLLAAGISGVTGEFVSGDVVDLAGLDHRPVARGVVSYDAAELRGIIGRRTDALPPEYRREVVHADDLVPLPGR
jgi:glutamate 5-kinase